MSHKNCPTKLQVSNLSKDTTHREIEAWMAGLRVGGATITKKKDSFILEFESAAQAARAKEVLSKNTYINGNVCKVVHYREFMVVGEVTAVVQGLTPESNFAAIEQAIRQFSGVTEVSFKKKTTKPYAFVSFEKMEQVNHMIKELHGSWVHGDFLRIFIVSDNSPSNGSNSSPNLNPPSMDGLSSPDSNPPNFVNSPQSPDATHVPGKAQRHRSTSLNTQISFDTFLSNISSNLASLVSPLNLMGKRTTNQPNNNNTTVTANTIGSPPALSTANTNSFTSFTNPTSFTTTPSPTGTISPTGNGSINRKNRSKSLNTGNKYSPTSMSGPGQVRSPISPPSGAASLFSDNIPSPTDAIIPTTRTGRTVSFSEAEGVSFQVPVFAGDESNTRNVGLTIDAKPIRVRSVSFDSNINALDSFDASGSDTIEIGAYGYSPNHTPSPTDLSPRVINSLSPNILNSPTNRLRSKSVGGTTPPKIKSPVLKAPVNDLFSKQHRGSKIPNPNPASPPLSDPSSEGGDDDSSDTSAVLSPSGSSNGPLSMPNLHYKNDYHTLRLEGLDEEITSSILYDLFNCVLDEPPSLLSAKAVHGQGFVDFDSADMASKAQEKLNGRKFMGHTLRISHVRPEEKCVLKVTNLPFSTDEKDLEDHFSDVAGLISANIVRKVTGISKGFAFLVFGHLSAAEKALQEKHGTIVQGRPINIRHHNSNNNNNNNRATTKKETPNPSSPTSLLSPPTPSQILSPVQNTEAIGPRQVTKVVRGELTKENGEQPDDAALSNMTDEEAQKYLVQFSKEFALVVQKVHSIETNYTHLKERLRQNNVRIEAAKNKLNEKRLEQHNDDLEYAKQKLLFKSAQASDPSNVGSPNGSFAASELEKERLQLKKMRAMKQASLRKIIEELSDQLNLAKIVKELEEEKQLLENHQVQLEMIEMINSLSETIKKISLPKLRERIAQSNMSILEKTKEKEELQRVQDLKRSYDIDLDAPTPPRATMASWPNDEAVKVDTFQLHFTDDRFSLRCCNIQLTRASIRPKSFSRGAHLAYWIKLASDPKAVYVAKSSILSESPEDDKLACMQDITSQLYASNSAKAFTERKLGKTLEYVPIQLLCFYQRNPPVYMTIEPALEGIWKRYTNANSLLDPERNAFINAFSHFSYEYSTGKLIVTDLQGTKAQEKYFLTDPSVHYIHPVDDAFGKANLGHEGIAEFFRTHSCNSFCRALKLTPQRVQPLDPSSPLTTSL